MTDTLFCTFCQAPEDVTGMKVVDNCDLLRGEPCGACKDYAAIEVKISAARQVLHDLVMDRVTIRARVNQHHDAITSRVPAEILCSIFQFCFPANDFDVFDNNARRQPEKDKQIIAGPLLLGSICKTWRSIAWGMQSLWTVSRLFLDRFNDPNYVDLVKEWLGRAGNRLPLSIQIASRCPEDKGIDFKSTAIGLTEILNKTSKQWKNFDYIGPLHLLSYFRGDAAGTPGLHSLTLKNQPDHWRDEGQFSIKASQPQPSRIYLDDWPLRLVHINWKHLTVVHLFKMCVNECVELFRLATAIKCCRFNLIKKEDQDHHTQISELEKPVIYEALESLAIDRYEPHTNANYWGTISQAEEIVTFFGCFLFPNLKHLKAESGGNEDRPRSNSVLSWAPVITHLANSSPPLVSLTIQSVHTLGGRPFTDCIIPILKINPLLREVEVSTLMRFGPKWGEEQEEALKFLQLLADTSSNKKGLFLPNLQIIKLRVKTANTNATHEFWSHIPDIFGNPLQTENACCRPLKTLRIQVERNFHKIHSKDIILRLRALQEKGIFLDVCNCGDRDMYEKVIGRRLSPNQRKKR